MVFDLCLVVFISRNITYAFIPLSCCLFNVYLVVRMIDTEIELKSISTLHSFNRGGGVCFALTPVVILLIYLEIVLWILNRNKLYTILGGGGIYICTYTIVSIYAYVLYLW